MSMEKLLWLQIHISICISFLKYDTDVKFETHIEEQCSIQEMLLRCYHKYTFDLFFTIENIIIALKV